MSAVIFDKASATQRIATANIAAECRGIESGRNCRWNAERGCFEVKSESGPRTYHQTVSTVGDLLVVSCDCPAGPTQKPAGELACKHRAKAARYLERMGWASFGTDGLWHVTDKALEAARAQ